MGFNGSGGGFSGGSGGGGGGPVGQLLTYPTFAAFKAATVASPTVAIQALILADETNAGAESTYQYDGNGVINYVPTVKTNQ